MLFGGWEVRIVKKQWQKKLRPRAAFSCPRSQFFTIRSDPKPVKTYLFFSKLSNENKLTEKKNSRKRYCDRGQRNPDRVKNQSDRRIRYRDRLEKNKRLYLHLYVTIYN